LGVWVQPYENAAFTSVEDSNFTAKQESSEQCPINVDFFFDIDSNVCKEFVPPLQKVNGNFYCNILSQLTENIQHKCLDMWRNNWALHHDNALAQMSLVVQLFFGYFEHDSHPPPSLLTGPRPVIILPIPEDQIDVQGAMF
jgi:hypothetical protein